MLCKPKRIPIILIIAKAKNISKTADKIIEALGIGSKNLTKITMLIRIKAIIMTSKTFQFDFSHLKNRPNMGTKIPNKGLEPYNPDKHKYPEQIHHRVALGMDCGSYIGKGWYNIICDLDDAISKIYPMYIVDQVKEKFG